jgi:thymidylate synthase (FAD)
MKVTYIDHMGTDLSVVNAARVSFAKRSKWEGGSHPDFDPVKALSFKDQKLIRYLAEHNHWTPFGHTAVTLHVKAPLFVARQLGKHQVGLVWNEVSRRYVSEVPEIYTPDVWRKRAENVKQGSSDEAVNIDGLWMNNYMDTALDAYEALLEVGVCPEQARMVLPQSMYTEWYWTGSIAAFSRVWHLRADSHTQRETQQIAEQIDEVIAPLFPVSWDALTCST